MRNCATSSISVGAKVTASLEKKVQTTFHLRFVSQINKSLKESVFHGKVSVNSKWASQVAFRRVNMRLLTEHLTTNYSSHVRIIYKIHNFPEHLRNERLFSNGYTAEILSANRKRYGKEMRRIYF